MRKFVQQKFTIVRTYSRSMKNSFANNSIELIEFILPGDIVNSHLRAFCSGRPAVWPAGGGSRHVRKRHLHCVRTRLRAGRHPAADGARPRALLRQRGLCGAFKWHSVAIHYLMDSGFILECTSSCRVYRQYTYFGNWAESVTGCRIESRHLLFLHLNCSNAYTLLLFSIHRTVSQKPSMSLISAVYVVYFCTSNLFT